MNKKFDKIVINGRFLTQKLTGVQRYALEITKAFDSYIKNFPLQIELVVPKNCNKESIPSLKNISIIYFGSNSGIKWEQLDLARYLKRNNALGIHLCNSVPLLCPKGICTVHDITYKVNPQFITTKHLALAKIWHLVQYKVAIKKSIHVFTVSEYSRKEIIQVYKINPEKISVAYNGWQHFNNKIEGSDSLKIFPVLKSKKYYFSLATMAKNKNFPWIVQAARQNSDTIFAVAGNLDIKKLGDSLGKNLPSNLLSLGYVSDNDAKILMKNCKAFLFPSFYEGFGIPPLEALAMEAKVVCSNAACLPEVFMDCVYYIDPYKPCPNLDSLLKEKVAPAKKVLESYSWDISSKIYLTKILSLIDK